MIVCLVITVQFSTQSESGSTTKWCTPRIVNAWAVTLVRIGVERDANCFGFLRHKPYIFQEGVLSCQHRVSDIWFRLIASVNHT